MSGVVVRVAPSPTGRLHLGNARAAVFNDLFARRHGGRLILRLDDTDRERSTEEFADGIVRDLAWLGVKVDHRVRQSDRLDFYQEAADRLRAAGYLYPCYETPEELEHKRQQQRARGLPPLYDREALLLTEEQKAACEAEGRRPHWRFRVRQGPVVWNDMIRGVVDLKGDMLGDPVLVRADGQPVYTLASVVDDLAMGITHIVRGADHVTNTAIQICVMEALGGEIPEMAHFPLVTDASGAGFSKREGSLGLDQLREQGLEPMAIVSVLAALGSSRDPVPAYHPDELAATFDLASVSASAPAVTEEMLWQMNRRILASAPWPWVREMLARVGAAFDEATWGLVRNNVASRAGIVHWYGVLEGDEADTDAPVGQVAPADKDFLRAARDQLDTLVRAGVDAPLLWETWIRTLKENSGRSGPALFRPLRQALTGLDHGPDLAALLARAGRERVQRRLHRVLAQEVMV
jgi:glutamyl-tRNA synthetase